MTPPAPLFDWQVPALTELTAEALAAASERGLSRRLLRVLSRRGRSGHGAELRASWTARREPCTIPCFCRMRTASEIGSRRAVVRE